MLGNDTKLRKYEITKMRDRTLIDSIVDCISEWAKRRVGKTAKGVYEKTA